MEQLISIFSHKRSFEALKLGYVTANIGGDDPRFSQFVDVCIRLLGEKWKIANYHGVLDWRLGLDIARLSMEKNYFTNFCIPYWKHYLKSVISYFNYSKQIGEGLYIINDKENITLITHPFWSTNYINRIKKMTNNDNIQEKNIIEIVNDLKG